MRYAADLPELGDTHSAGPSLVHGPILVPVPQLAYQAVRNLWEWVCRDKANGAMLTSVMGSIGRTPQILWNRPQWRRGLADLRHAVVWNVHATKHAPALVHRRVPVSWVTDYMIPNRPNHPPLVGFTPYTSGRAWFLRLWKKPTQHLGWQKFLVRIRCMQVVIPRQQIPIPYIQATRNQPWVALTLTPGTY
jgi:hypothetical protein